jgi:rubrerythrin
MFNRTVENVMNDLIQLDVDTYHAYGDAIKAIKEKDIHQQLVAFQKDHKRHIKELTDLLRALGGEPIKHTRDFKGFVIEGMTMLQSLTGTKGALSAMLTNEKITNEKYADILEYTGFTQETRKLIHDNFSDEKRHFKYIKEKLDALVDNKALT